MDTFTIDGDWLDHYGVDLEAFMAALEDAHLDPYPDDDGVWRFDAADTNPHDGIPDFIANLVTNPGETNVSQGGDIIGN